MYLFASNQNFMEMDEMIIKWIWKLKGLRIMNTILKKTKVEWLTYMTYNFYNFYNDLQFL